MRNREGNLDLAELFGELAHGYLKIGSGCAPAERQVKHLPKPAGKNLLSLHPESVNHGGR